MGTHLWSLKSNLQIKKWSNASPTDVDWLGTLHPTNAASRKPLVENWFSSTPENVEPLPSVVIPEKLFKASKLTDQPNFNRVEPLVELNCFESLWRLRISPIL